MSTLIKTSGTPRKRPYSIGLAKGSSGAPDGANVDFSTIWSTIQRGRWLILITCFVVTAAVTGYTLTLPKVYQASSIVSVGASPAVLSAGVWPAEEGIELSKEVGLLESSGELNRRVVETLRGAAEADSSARLTIFEPVEGEELTTLDVINRLNEQVTFQALGDRSMIRIEAESESPEEATLIVNAYAEEYRRFSQEMARAGVVAARTFLEDQVGKRRQEITRIEREWEEFALANDVATEGETGQRIASAYVELETRKDALQFELEQEQRRKSILTSQLEKLQPTLRTSVLAEQRARGLRTQLQFIEEEVAQLQLEADQYYMNNPDLRGNESQVPQLADLKRRIDGYEKQKETLAGQLVTLLEDQDRTIPGTETAGSVAVGQMTTLQERISEQDLQIRELESQIRYVDRQIAQFQGRIETIPRQTIRREQIRRRLAQAEEFYAGLVEELQTTIIAEESELGYVNLVRAGYMPRLPVSPDLNQNILLGLLLGFGFGMGLAFIAQSINPRVYEPKDIQSHGYNLLGVIPTMDPEIKSAFNGDDTIEVDGRTLSTTLIPLLNPWSTVTENYRLMRTNLQYPGFAEENDRPQVLLVTSPEPGDGKTTTATNLAVTFALSGRKTLLIDADLRRPNAHNLLGLQGFPGLADVLSRKKEMNDVLQNFIEDLAFLPAGETSVPPAEMLDSQRMKDVLARGRENADVIIIDTPPVLSASDALVLAVQCDATLVVAHAGKTDRHALEQVEKTFSAVGVSISAVIFNQFGVEMEYEYGYGSDDQYAPTLSA